MKKSVVVLMAVAAAVVLLFFWVKNSYNGLVSHDESVTNAWSQVENNYQRRADLIPNLVATVKGYAAHESETLEAVISARSRATQVVVDPTETDAEDIVRFQKAQGELSSALGRLLMLTENYPDLKANENFKELQTQLESTENRISIARMKYNDAAKEYNTMVRQFPKNMIASMFDFEPRAYFEAQEGAEQAPKVEF